MTVGFLSEVLLKKFYKLRYCHDKIFLKRVILLSLCQFSGKIYFLTFSPDLFWIKIWNLFDNQYTLTCVEDVLHICWWQQQPEGSCWHQPLPKKFCKFILIKDLQAIFDIRIQVFRRAKLCDRLIFCMSLQFTTIKALNWRTNLRL